METALSNTCKGTWQKWLKDLYIISRWKNEVFHLRKSDENPRVGVTNTEDLLFFGLCCNMIEQFKELVVSTSTVNWTRGVIFNLIYYDIHKDLIFLCRLYISAKFVIMIFPNVTTSMLRPQVLITMFLEGICPYMWAIE